MSGLTLFKKLILVLVTLIGFSQALALCSTINSEGTTLLTQNLSLNTSTCITVTSANATLDCQGFTISAFNSSAMLGINVSADNVTIKNCNFIDFIANYTSYAIYSYGLNTTVYNSTFVNLSGVYNGQNNASNFTNNYLSKLNSSAGFIVFLNSNSTFAHNNVSNITSNDVNSVLNLGEYDVVYNNTIYAYDAGVSLGIYAAYNYVNITNNTIRNITTPISLHATANFSVINSNVISSTSSSSVIVNGINATISNNVVEAPVNNTGIGAVGNYSNVSYNTIYGAGYGLTINGPDNTASAGGWFGTAAYNIISTSKDAIQVGANSSVYNNVINNTISDYFGILAQYGNYSRIYNNVIFNSSSARVTAVQVLFANYTTFYNNTAYNMFGANSSGFRFNYSANVTIYDSNFSNTSTALVLNASNVSVINSSFNLGVSISNESSLHIQTPVNVTVVNLNGSAFTSTVNISNGVFYSAGSTDSNGYYYANVTSLYYDGSNSLQNYSNSTFGVLKAQYGYNVTNFSLPTNYSGSYVRVNVSIPDNLPASYIVITSPTNNSNVSGLNSFNVTAIDNYTNIFLVQMSVANTSGLLFNSVAQTSGNTSNLTYNFSVLEDGEYFITANVYDDYFNFDNSTNITIMVNTSRPPQIRNIQATTTASSIAFSWTTGEKSNSTISYGTTTALGLSSGNSSNVTNHSIDLSSLNASTLYYYNVTSCDAYGYCNTTGPFSATTSAASSSSSGSGGSGGGSASSVSSSSNASKIDTESGFDLVVGENQTSKIEVFDSKNKYAIKMFRNGKVAYQYANSAHSITLFAVTSSSASFEIASKPQNVTIRVGEEKTFDITNDGKEDIRVKLISTSNGTSAVLEFSAITEVKTINPPVIEKSTQVIESPSENKTSANTTPSIQLIIIGALVLLAGLYWLSIKKGSK